MPVSSPYAVFKAAELTWPARPLVAVMPPLGLTAAAAAKPARKRSKRQSGSPTPWSAPIQGELFQLV
ncbi:MAG: hypothetical protein VKM98_03000 [Cyanobacteriota bacterium]|nr:hypothetical protein [Cyanobacteriota bacterium]